MADSLQHHLGVPPAVDLVPTLIPPEAVITEVDMADVDKAIARLQAGAVEDLVRRGWEFFLERPVADLVDPDWVAHLFVETLENTAHQPRTERWVRERVEWMRTNMSQGHLRQYVPGEVMEPLQDVLRRPVVFERELMARMLDHPAVESMLRDVLVGAIESFVRPGRAVASAVAGSAAGQVAKGRLGRLKALGENVLGGVGTEVLGEISHEVELKTKARIRDYVDGAIHLFVAQLVDRVSSPEHAQGYADYRAHLLDTVLDTPIPQLAKEVDKLDPEELVATGAALARALAKREGFEEEIASAIRGALDEVGDGTLRGFLDESGVGEAWRAEVEAEMGRHAREFVATPEFREWFDALFDDA